MTSQELARNAKAWPFVEARKLMKRFEQAPPAKGYALFQTGYGPSGLPHIGTFGEVARTSMVRRAFQRMSDIPTRLFVFSDDMDGLRKAPDNVPNPERLEPFIGLPLTRVPDPFGTHESFGHHNNARLRGFLDRFGFDYAFKSATDCYASGLFDETLLTLLRNHRAVRDIMLPTLGPERRRTYSPFLPICPRSGRVLQARVVETRPDDGGIVYEDPDTGALVEVPVTGGGCKLQWKPDWAMRWAALRVDYEMSGKDLIDSVTQSGKITRVLGNRPPEGFTYELFLDANGEKISKSRGNGLTVEEWLEYAPAESLALFMFQKPKAAKRLYFDVIPRTVDDYLTFRDKFDAETDAKRLDNPAWHIHAGAPPREPAHLSFSILLNLASVCGAADAAVLWGFIGRYAPEATPETAPFLDRLVRHALRYHRDFVKPAKVYRAPTPAEREALRALAAALRALPAEAEAEAIQAEVYAVGKGHPETFPRLRDWFQTLYEVLLGQSQGPRFGSFVALYGVAETLDLVERAIAGEDLAA